MRLLSAGPLPCGLCPGWQQVHQFLGHGLQWLAAALGAAQDERPPCRPARSGLPARPGAKARRPPEAWRPVGSPGRERGMGGLDQAVGDAAGVDRDAGYRAARRTARGQHRLAPQADEALQHAGGGAGRAGAKMGEHLSRGPADGVLGELLFCRRGSGGRSSRGGRRCRRARRRTRSRSARASR